MITWTSKHWGAVIGALIVFSASIIGIGLTALAVLAGILGYLIGKFLDGELDLADLQDRAQGRTREPVQERSNVPPRVQ